MTHQLLFSEAEVFTGHSNDSVKRPAFKPTIMYSFGDCSVRVSDERIDVFTKSSREVAIKKFLRKRVREGSANPSFCNICNFLVDFDEQWKAEFKTQIAMDPNGPALRTSLQSLVDARNDFAHGGSPTVSITDILRYFEDARRVVEILDIVIN